MSAHRVSWEQDLTQQARQLLASLRANPIQPLLVRLSAAELAGMIDHTLLKAEATPAMVD